MVGGGRSDLRYTIYDFGYHRRFSQSYGKAMFLRDTELEMSLLTSSPTGFRETDFLIRASSRRLLRGTKAARTSRDGHEHGGRSDAPHRFGKQRTLLIVDKVLIMGYCVSVLHAGRTGRERIPVFGVRGADKFE